MKTFTRISVLFVASLALGAVSHAQSTQPAATPPMGWNSWNHFANKVDDAGSAPSPMRWSRPACATPAIIYVNIDDTWEGTRDAKGVIQTNKKFPDMKALADYVHSKGLKLGIYSAPGPKTCAGFEGQLRPRRAGRANLRRAGASII